MGCVNFRRNWEKFSLWIHQLAESSLDFNGAGNILTDVRPGETFAYTYNNRNRLSSVTRNAAVWGTYIYNGMEQLVSRVSQSPAAPVGTIHYIYDLEPDRMASCAILLLACEAEGQATGARGTPSSRDIGMTLPPREIRKTATSLNEVENEIKGNLSDMKISCRPMSLFTTVSHFRGAVHFPLFF
jgi:YD repeat-containing protein